MPPVKEHVRRLLRQRRTWFDVHGRTVRVELGRATHPGIGFRVTEHCEGVTACLRCIGGIYVSIDGQGRDAVRVTGAEIYAMPEEGSLVFTADLLSDDGEWPHRRHVYVDILDKLFGAWVSEEEDIVNEPGAGVPLPEGPVTLDSFRVSRFRFRRARVPYGVPWITGQGIRVHWDRAAGLGMPDHKLRDCQASTSPLRSAPRGWGAPPWYDGAALRRAAIAQIAADVVEARVRYTEGVHRVELD